MTRIYTEYGQCKFADVHVQLTTASISEYNGAPFMEFMQIPQDFTKIFHFFWQQTVVQPKKICTSVINLLTSPYPVANFVDFF